MTLLLVGLVVLGLSAVGALAAGRSARWGPVLGVGGAVAGCALGVGPAVQAVLGGPIESIYVPWPVPFGAFALSIDALSGFFLATVLSLSAVTALYGVEYMRHEGSSGAPDRSWFFFNLLVASMALVVTARNGVLFLFAWEGMTVASFFLVTHDDTNAQARAAGWTYLVAMQLSAAFLLALFGVLSQGAPTLDFDTLGVATSGAAGAAFLLAVVGFGTKAGLAPFHVWLPEAHPAAPSHVSALMSGVMVKTGIYGLMRTLTFLGEPEAWWGWTLLGIGLVSGIGGVAFALAQHDLKRLLAYHTVENVGIIAMGLGLGVLGAAAHAPTLMVLGYGAALLHVVNHALFKGLLFLGAGAVARATGTLEIDRLGGLLRRMPWTGATFALGAAAITGLPPLNGFVSEFLLVFAGIGDLASELPTAPVAGVAVIGGLGLISGLAAACFTKVFGVVFLGQARIEGREAAQDPGRPMRVAFVILAAGCVLIGGLAPIALRALSPVLRVVVDVPGPVEEATIEAALGPLTRLAWASLALVGLIALLTVVRWRLLRGRRVTRAVTWDCGYAAPSVRMQYTGASFVQPLTRLWQPLLRTSTHEHGVEGYFPTNATFASHTADVGHTLAFQPLFANMARAITPLRRLQHGNTHLYVLNIALALLILAIWRLG